MHFNKVLSVLSIAAVAIASPHPNPPAGPITNVQTGGVTCNQNTGNEGTFNCCSGVEKNNPDAISKGLQALGSGPLSGLLNIPIQLLAPILAALNVQAAINCTPIGVLAIPITLNTCQGQMKICCANPGKSSSGSSLISVLSDDNLNLCSPIAL